MYLITSTHLLTMYEPRTGGHKIMYYICRPAGLDAFGASKLIVLIVLDKSPSVRPIGISEIVHRIIGVTILPVIKFYITEAAGSLQFCAGKESGCEAAMNSIYTTFHDPATKASLLIVASNTFNTLNRKLDLKNIQRLCPSLATILVNTNRDSPSLLY